MMEPSLASSHWREVVLQVYCLAGGGGGGGGGGGWGSEQLEHAVLKSVQLVSDGPQYSHCKSVRCERTTNLA
jgi:hypothetical protein